VTDYRQIDEPQPTIVGPRPAEGEGGKMKIPQGLERLLTLAGISAEWRGKVLADPLGAAGEARIGLSKSERAILRATPRSALSAMADSFARKHGGSPVIRYATGAVAAAALLATGIAYAADSPSAKGGARADEPEPKRPAGMETEGGIRPDIPEEAPPVLWMTELEDALAQANKDKRAVMAVFLSPSVVQVEQEDMPVAVIGARAYRVTEEQKSQRICLSDSKEFRTAVKKANLAAVKIAKPAKPPTLGMNATAEEIGRAEAAQKVYERAAKAYEAAIQKYGLDEKKLPAVVWLAPDGSELSKAVQPDDEKIFVKLIGDAPPLLAKWITEQRKQQELRRATDGIRPDEPVTKGSRPDVPLAPDGKPAPPDDGRW
jgi:hypothetical protein